MQKLIRKYTDPYCAHHYGNTTYPCSCPPEPTTPTGKRHFDRVQRVGYAWFKADDIIAIEQEAAAAAKADADRLAEALRNMTHTVCDGWLCVQAREALRLHDTAKEAERERGIAALQQEGQNVLDSGIRP